MDKQVIVGQQVAGEAKKVRKQLESLISDVNKSQFDIATLLHTIKRNGFYEGFTTFSEYVATLEIKPRKAQYLRRMAEVMEIVGVPREKYEPIGIGKLREITSLDPNGTWVNPETKQETPLKEFITGFIDKAGTFTLADVRQHVRTLKGFVGENDLVWANFLIVRSVRDNVVDKAKELARRNIGSVGKDEEGVSKDASDGACLEVWCAEYNNNPANNVLAEEETQGE